MTTTKKILQAIIDYPGSTAAELLALLGDKVSLVPSDIQPRIHTYIADGRVIIEKRDTDGAKQVNTYRASKELVAAFDGQEQLVTNAPRKTAGRPAYDPAIAFEVGFSSGGRITISKGGKKIDLSREETAALLEFLDCINIEKITGASA
ncbi:hypothetical protein [Burkholderia perseverans]|uniref:hypothetical protein n=1 Tax=Burkholderia perseverans TaxID=2615214 RepID=UPI001FEE596C|nr:hypothetical protein [Burkholderia perseverans]